MRYGKYLQMREYLAEKPKLDRAVSLLSRGLTIFIYISYTAQALFLLLKKDKKAAGFLGVPAAVFVSGSLIRRSIDAPRPGDVLDLKIRQTGKESTRCRGKERNKRKGKSFPSRHSFSAAVVAAAFGWLDKRAGAVMGAAAVCLGICRVLKGSHWIKDVAAGLAYGTGGGLAGFHIIDIIEGKH